MERRFHLNEVRHATDDVGLAPDAIRLAIRRVHVAPDTIRADLGHLRAVSDDIQIAPDALRFEKTTRRAAAADVRLDSIRCHLDRSGDVSIVGHVKLRAKVGFDRFPPAQKYGQPYGPRANQSLNLMAVPPGSSLANRAIHDNLIAGCAVVRMESRSSSAWANLF